jgi:hypothetical protein
VLCALRWRPALSTLAARMAAEGLDAADLLSSLFAAPPGSEEEGVQLAALQYAATALQQRRRGGGKKGGAAAGTGACLQCCQPVSRSDWLLHSQPGCSMLVHAFGYQWEGMFPGCSGGRPSNLLPRQLTASAPALQAA